MAKRSESFRRAFFTIRFRTNHKNTSTGISSLYEFNILQSVIHDQSCHFLPDAICGNRQAVSSYFARQLITDGRGRDQFWATPMSVISSEFMHALKSEIESAPNSHASSFDGSLGSQGSNREPLSAKVNQQSKNKSSQESTTPPTTTSNFSSQESQAQESRASPHRPSPLPHVLDPAARLRPLSVDVTGVHKPIAHLADAETAVSIPNKRLANGEIKYGEKSRSSSPIKPERSGHSRTTSINTKDSPIREVRSSRFASPRSTLRQFQSDVRSFQTSSAPACHMPW